MRKRLSNKTAEVQALKAQLHGIREQARAFRESNRCFFFKPYGWQQRAIDLISKKNISVVAAPNKIGKCLTYQTLIDTPQGELPIGFLYEKGEPFDVYSWNGESMVIGHALAPFKKQGLHKCYRLEMSDGRFIEGADDHFILTSSGIWRSFASIHQESSLELFQLSHASGEAHLMQRQSDWKDHYSCHYHQYDEQPLFAPGNVQVCFPSRVDVPQHNDRLLHLDDLEDILERNLFEQYDLPSNSYAHHHYEDQFFGSLFYNADRFFLSLHDEHTESSQLSIAEVSFLQQGVLPRIQSLDHQYSFSSSCPLYVDTNKIVSIYPIGCKEIYDFTVEKYHNYFAGGLVHHNTCLNANIAYSWIIGYEPWTMKDKEFEGSIKQGSMFYRPSSLGIKPPVKIRITGEDWKSHLGETVIPAFKHWFPKRTYKTKRNEQGVEYLWTFENGSTIELMTYKQKEELSESWMGHGWIPDEPPPKWLWGGMSRGVFLSGGKVFIPTTPLKEAWILDDLILSDRRDIGVIDDLLITDNEDLYKDEKDKLLALGLQEHHISVYFDLLLWKDKEKQIYVDDRGKEAKKFLEGIIPVAWWDEIDKLKILRFVQDTEPDDAPSRFGGAFRSLVGRVLKSFRKEIHWIEPFKVPTDWPVVAMIDFHLNKPHAISFHAVNKQDVCFVIHEIWENMSTEELADSIIRYKTNNALRLEEAYIDPLSKGDTGYMRNRLGTEVRDSYSIIEERLAEHDIVLDVASKDKTSGIMNIEARLKGVNGMPTYYVFNTCARHFYEVMRWVYDEGEPKKEYDDMMENWYRATLSGLHFEDMRPKNIKYPDNIGAHAWMGA